MAARFRLVKYYDLLRLLLSEDIDRYSDNLLFYLFVCYKKNSQIIWLLSLKAFPIDSSLFKPPFKAWTGLTFLVVSIDMGVSQ